MGCAGRLPQLPGTFDPSFMQNPGLLPGQGGDLGPRYRGAMGKGVQQQGDLRQLWQMVTQVLFPLPCSFFSSPAAFQSRFLLTRLIFQGLTAKAVCPRYFSEAFLVEFGVGKTTLAGGGREEHGTMLGLMGFLRRMQAVVSYNQHCQFTAFL